MISETVHYTPVWPHGTIQEVFPDVFFVTGANKINHEGVHIQTSRNMVIFRNGNQLTLINTVRLNEKELKHLDSLGKVTHIIRIGAFHGRDDAFYRNQYPASTLWTLNEMTMRMGFFQIVI